MKIKVRYENELATFKLDSFEIKGWLNLELQPDESEEDFEKRVQEDVDIQYNRPEYNIMHKQERHRGYSVSIKDEYEKEIKEPEPSISEVRNLEMFFKDELDRKRKEGYEAVRDYVYFVLKPEIAELFMDVRIYQIPINEKAQSMLTPSDYATEEEYSKAVARLANSISQKLKRATKKLKKYFYKASDFGICQGYQVEGSSSFKEN